MTMEAAASSAPQIPILFEDAPLLYFGRYEDETVQLYINRRLTDASQRAVTIAHELGHTFGLEHVAADERDSVMNSGNRTIVPTAEDADAVRALWPTCGE